MQISSGKRVKDTLNRQYIRNIDLFGIRKSNKCVQTFIFIFPVSQLKRIVCKMLTIKISYVQSSWCLFCEETVGRRDCQIVFNAYLPLHGNLKVNVMNKYWSTKLKSWSVDESVTFQFIIKHGFQNYSTQISHYKAYETF